MKQFFTAKEVEHTFLANVVKQVISNNLAVYSSLKSEYKTAVDTLVKGHTKVAADVNTSPTSMLRDDVDALNSIVNNDIKVMYRRAKALQGAQAKAVFDDKFGIKFFSKFDDKFIENFSSAMKDILGQDDRFDRNNKIKKALDTVLDLYPKAEASFNAMVEARASLDTKTADLKGRVSNMDKDTLESYKAKHGVYIKISEDIDELDFILKSIKVKGLIGALDSDPTAGARLMNLGDKISTLLNGDVEFFNSLLSKIRESIPSLKSESSDRSLLRSFEDVYQSILDIRGSVDKLLEDRKSLPIASEERDVLDLAISSRQKKEKELNEEYARIKSILESKEGYNGFLEDVAKLVALLESFKPKLESMKANTTKSLLDLTGYSEYNLRELMKTVHTEKEKVISLAKHMTSALSNGSIEGAKVSYSLEGSPYFGLAYGSDDLISAVELKEILISEGFMKGSFLDEEFADDTISEVSSLVNSLLSGSLEEPVESDYELDLQSFKEDFINSPSFSNILDNKGILYDEVDGSFVPQEGYEKKFNHVLDTLDKNTVFVSSVIAEKNYLRSEFRKNINKFDMVKKIKESPDSKALLQSFNDRLDSLSDLDSKSDFLLGLRGASSLTLKKSALSKIPDSMMNVNLKKVAPIAFGSSGMKDGEENYYQAALDAVFGFTTKDSAYADAEQTEFANRLESARDFTRFKRLYRDLNGESSLLSSVEDGSLIGEGGKALIAKEDVEDFFSLLDTVVTDLKSGEMYSLSAIKFLMNADLPDYIVGDSLESEETIKGVFKKEMASILKDLYEVEGDGVDKLVNSDDPNLVKLNSLKSKLDSLEMSSSVGVSLNKAKEALSKLRSEKNSLVEKISKEELPKGLRKVLVAFVKSRKIDVVASRGIKKFQMKTLENYIKSNLPALEVTPDLLKLSKAVVDDISLEQFIPTIEDNVKKLQIALDKELGAEYIRLKENLKKYEDSYSEGRDSNKSLAVKLGGLEATIRKSSQFKNIVELSASMGEKVAPIVDLSYTLGGLKEIIERNNQDPYFFQLLGSLEGLVDLRKSESLSGIENSLNKLDSISLDDAPEELVSAIGLLRANLESKKNDILKSNDPADFILRDLKRLNSYMVDHKDSKNPLNPFRVISTAVGNKATNNVDVFLDKVVKGTGDFDFNLKVNKIFTSIQSMLDKADYNKIVDIMDHLENFSGSKLKDYNDAVESFSNLDETKAIDDEIQTIKDQISELQPDVKDLYRLEVLKSTELPEDAYSGKDSLLLQRDKLEALIKEDKENLRKKRAELDEKEKFYLDPVQDVSYYDKELGDAKYGYKKFSAFLKDGRLLKAYEDFSNALDDDAKKEATQSFIEVLRDVNYPVPPKYTYSSVEEIYNKIVSMRDGFLDRIKYMSSMDRDTFDVSLKEESIRKLTKEVRALEISVPAHILERDRLDKMIAMEKDGGLSKDDKATLSKLTSDLEEKTSIRDQKLNDYLSDRELSPVNLNLKSLGFSNMEDSRLVEKLLEDSLTPVLSRDSVIRKFFDKKMLDDENFDVGVNLTGYLKNSIKNIKMNLDTKENLQRGLGNTKEEKAKYSEGGFYNQQAPVLEDGKDFIQENVKVDDTPIEDSIDKSVVIEELAVNLIHDIRRALTSLGGDSEAIEGAEDYLDKFRMKTTLPLGKKRPADLKEKKEAFFDSLDRAGVANYMTVYAKIGSVIGKNNLNAMLKDVFTSKNSYVKANPYYIIIKYYFLPFLQEWSSNSLNSDSNVYNSVREDLESGLQLLLEEVSLSELASAESSQTEEFFKNLINKNKEELFKSLGEAEKFTDYVVNGVFNKASFNRALTFFMIPYHPGVVVHKKKLYYIPDSSTLKRFLNASDAQRNSMLGLSKTSAVGDIEVSNGIFLLDFKGKFHLDPDSRFFGNMIKHSQSNFKNIYKETTKMLKPIFNKYFKTSMRNVDAYIEDDMNAKNLLNLSLKEYGRFTTEGEALVEEYKYSYSDKLGKNLERLEKIRKNSSDGLSMRQQTTYDSILTKLGYSDFNEYLTELGRGASPVSNIKYIKEYIKLRDELRDFELFKSVDVTELYDFLGRIDKLMPRFDRFLSSESNKKMVRTLRSKVVGMITEAEISSLENRVSVLESVPLSESAFIYLEDLDKGLFSNMDRIRRLEKLSASKLDRYGESLNKFINFGLSLDAKKDDIFNELIKETELISVHRNKLSNVDSVIAKVKEGGLSSDTLAELGIDLDLSKMTHPTEINSALFKSLRLNATLDKYGVDYTDYKFGETPSGKDDINSFLDGLRDLKGKVRSKINSWDSKIERRMDVAERFYETNTVKSKLREIYDPVYAELSMVKSKQKAPYLKLQRDIERLSRNIAKAKERGDTDKLNQFLVAKGMKEKEADRLKKLIDFEDHQTTKELSATLFSGIEVHEVKNLSALLRSFYLGLSKDMSDPEVVSKLASDIVKIKKSSTYLRDYFQDLVGKISEDYTVDAPLLLAIDLFEIKLSKPLSLGTPVGDSFREIKAFSKKDTLLIDSINSIISKVTTKLYDVVKSSSTINSGEAFLESYGKLGKHLFSKEKLGNITSASSRADLLDSLDSDDSSTRLLVSISKLQKDKDWSAAYELYVKGYDIIKSSKDFTGVKKRFKMYAESLRKEFLSHKDPTKNLVSLFKNLETVLVNISKLKEGDRGWISRNKEKDSLLKSIKAYMKVGSKGLSQREISTFDISKRVQNELEGLSIDYEVMNHFYKKTRGDMLEYRPLLNTFLGFDVVEKLLSETSFNKNVSSSVLSKVKKNDKKTKVSSSLSKTPLKKSEIRAIISRMFN